MLERRGGAPSNVPSSHAHTRGRPRASKRGAGGLLARDPGNSLDGEQDKRHGSIFSGARCGVQEPHGTVQGPSGDFREPARGVEAHRNMSSDMRRVLGGVTTMSTVLEQLAVDELRMPHTFLVLPEENNKLPRPKQWFAGRGRLHFVCAHGLELVSDGPDGTGFLVSQLKKWMNKHATLLQVMVMVIVATAAVTGTVASAGALESVVAALHCHSKRSCWRRTTSFFRRPGERRWNGCWVTSATLCTQQSPMSAR